MVEDLSAYSTHISTITYEICYTNTLIAEREILIKINKKLLQFHKLMCQFLFFSQSLFLNTA